MSETVSTASKGRPLSNALKSEISRNDAEREETFELGVASTLTNGPGKQLEREGEIDRKNAEKLEYEIKAAKRMDTGLECSDDSGWSDESEELYDQLVQSVDSVSKRTEDERATFDRYEFENGAEIEGRSSAGVPFENDADIVYANIDQIAEEVTEQDESLEDAAFRAARESGYQPAWASTESQIDWAIQYDKADDLDDIDEIAVPDDQIDTLGRLLESRGYETISFSEVDEEYEVDPESLEDEEMLPQKVDGLGLLYVTDTGKTARSVGNEFEESIQSYLTAFQPDEARSSVNDYYDKARNPEEYPESNTAELFREDEAFDKLLEEEEELRNADNPDEDGFESEGAQAVWAATLMMAYEGYGIDEIYDTLNVEPSNLGMTKRYAREVAGDYRMGELDKSAVEDFIASAYALVEENRGEIEGVIDEL
jgi:phosphoribosyl-ATP pyrophosphohydrolase